MKIWPGYVKPEDDELLSSWLFRNARSHKIKPHTFTKFYLRTANIWNRDIDKFLPETYITLLSNQTPLSIDDIKELQLSCYENIVYETPLYSAYTSGITNIGIYHRARKGYGLLACPKCLKDKGYFKKNWRLLSSIICLRCNSYLIDSCPNCEKPIIFQRLDIGDKNNFDEKPIYLCWNCNFDLTKAYKSNCICRSEDIKYQTFIDQTLEYGFNRYTQYSHLFFQVFFLVLRKIKTSSKNWNRVQNAFMKEFGLYDDEFFQSSSFTTLSFRTKVLPHIFKLFENWPDSFLYFCQKYKIRYSDFAKEKGYIPFWLYDVLKQL